MKNLETVLLAPSDTLIRPSLTLQSIPFLDDSLALFKHSRLQSTKLGKNDALSQSHLS